MIKLDPELIPTLSFADYPLLDFIFSKGEKKLEILADGAILRINDKRNQLEKVQLIISNWSDLKIQVYNSKNKILEDLSMNQAEPLGEISEYLIQDTTVILKGFGDESARWLEYTFIDPKMTCHYKEPVKLQS